ncbi:MAG: protein kinase [Planctomycetes bacterium]|nr:protein kinase [Planctomycetota bacterium]
MTGEHDPTLFEPPPAPASRLDDPTVLVPGPAPSGPVSSGRGSFTAAPLVDAPATDDRTAFMPPPAPAPGVDDPTILTPGPASTGRGSFAAAHPVDDRTAFTPPPALAPAVDDPTVFTPGPPSTGRGSFAAARPTDDRTAFTPPPQPPAPTAPTPTPTGTTPDDLTAPAPPPTTADAEDPAAALEAAPGSFVGGYEVVRTLGRGGMGIVYLARDPRLGRQVALKVLPITAGTHAGAVARFEREARAIAALDHPAIRPIHGWGRDDQARVFWLAMGFVQGRAYDDVVRDVGLGHESPRRAARVVADAARALAFAHRKGVIHRDVKPSNLMVEAGADGLKVHVVDFGLARLEGAAELTVEGQVMGTLRFMPPEQALGAEASALSDVYSLGATLFWALTGEGPYDVQRIENLQLRLARGDPARRPTALRPDVPRDLEAIALTALEVEPARRYAGADALADDLERFLAGEPVVARPPSFWRDAARRARRRAWLLAPAALVALAGGLLARTWRSGARGRRAPRHDLGRPRHDMPPPRSSTCATARRGGRATGAAAAALGAARDRLARVDEGAPAHRAPARAHKAVSAAVGALVRAPPAQRARARPEAAAPRACARRRGGAASAPRSWPQAGPAGTRRRRRARAPARARRLTLARGGAVTRTAAGACTLVTPTETRALLAGEPAALPAWGVLRQRGVARHYDPLDALEGFPALPARGRLHEDMLLVLAPGRAPFLIDPDEVSAGRFRAFVERDYDDDALWTEDERASRDGRRRRDVHLARLTPGDPRPATEVSFEEASAFARRHGRRLPTRAEWRVAAGLPPWRPPPAAREGRGEVRGVGDPPWETSPAGARNMAGNVAEWVEVWPWAMGGTADVGLSVEPYHVHNHYSFGPEVGFRCAADWPGGDR